MGLDNGYGLGIGSLKPGVCTSSTRPTSPYEGQMIYETDTDKVLVWNGSAWYANWNNAWGVVGYAAKTSDTSITTTTTDITGLTVTWTAVSGRLYKTSFQAIGFVNTADAYINIVISDGSNNRVQFVRNGGGATTSRFSLIGFIYETSLSGSVTRKARIDCNTGTASLDGGASYPTQFIVEDIGPA